MKEFLTDNYGLIPYTNQWMVISGKEQLKTFWCFESGAEYINKLEGKTKKKSRLKINKDLLSPVIVVDSFKTEH